MLIVITGAACSGKGTLAAKVLSHVEDSTELKVMTDACPYYGSSYDHVTCEQFSAVPDMLILNATGYSRYGISKSALQLALINVDTAYVLVCGHEDVILLSRLAPSLNTTSICAYLHCSPAELIKRLTKRQMRLNTEEAYEQLQTIYDDHNSVYAILEDMSIASSGFTAVIPINSGSTSNSFYQALIVDPLIAILDSFSIYKNMRQLRSTKNSLGALKHAD